ncbi:hypothetical protein BCY91_13930 [Pelobium manganitolerans]|uniref:Uncharacterized protein n=1 Tax=Pelobium manganitolerans TaxID=1842495 RepID=A0A419S9S3_9SPHI|nr:hypothetical protein [Pelobium manganitolerans]RKD18972.1 hypothetical protein BCY91_13930 [Pelobium manganitolerans]
MDENKYSNSVIVASAVVSCSRGFINSSNEDGRLELSGTWEFKEDPFDIGVKEKWYNAKSYESVQLPGSITTNGKGEDIKVETKWTGSIFTSSRF